MVQPQWIRSFYDAANHRNLDQYVSYFSESGQFKAIDTEEVFHGPREVRQMAEDWVRAFPDGRFEIRKVIGQGDEWSVEMIFVGTHQGPLAGPMGEIPATGKKVSVPSCDVITLRDGKIETLNCYMSGTVMMSQLGVMPGEGARKAA